MSRDFCNKCGECCRRIAVDFENRLIFFDGIQPLTQEFEQLLTPVDKTNNITFCSCNYLKGKLCTNKNKPKECINYPSSPFAYLPEGCGFYGETFSKLEKVKQQVRKLKEEILHYETMMVQDKSVQKIIDHHKAIINKYKLYGSDDW